jgi:hypothetical protein
MASFSKRIFKSWRVSVALQGDLNKAFDALEQAQAYAQQLNVAGQPLAQTRPYQSTGWQARIRSKLAPQLTRTFPTKASAEEWAKAREGEIVKRQFIDYREADRFTFGDLLRRYEVEHLSHLGEHDPDRARITKMCRHPITLIRMSALQASDFARYRDQRLKGGFAEPKQGGNAPKVWPPGSPRQLGKRAFQQAKDTEFPTARRFMGHMMALNTPTEDAKRRIGVFLGRARPEGGGRPLAVQVCCQRGWRFSKNAE